MASGNASLDLGPKTSTGAPSDFRELVQRKRRFVVPAALAVVVCFGTNLALATFAGDLMGTRILDGPPLARVLASAQVVLTWVVTWGAVVGVLGGLIASLTLIVLSAPVWPGPDSEGSPLGSLGLANPAIFSIPIGFLCCWLGTVLSTERGAERSYHELYVRSETGLGAEAASVH